MKRAFFIVLIAAVIVICIPKSGRAEGQRIGFFANLGFMTKEGLSPNWLTLGPELMILLGTRLSFNPEVTIWGSNFGFRSYYVVPGALFNIQTGHFILGAGAIRRFWFSRYGDGDSSEQFSLKFQVGYRSRNSRIALIVIPLSSQNTVSFGLALGMGF